MLVPMVSFAQSKTLEKLHYVKINDSSLGLSMIVPENTVFDKPQNGEKIENPLMPDGRPYLRLDWQGMKVEIDIFKASFDFFQVDWLNAFTLLSGFDVVSLKSIRNTSELSLGELRFANKNNNDPSSLVYLAVVDGRGFLISGFGAESNDLVQIIGESLALGGASIGSFDDNKDFEFLEHKLTFKNSFVEIDFSKEGNTFKVISDSSELANSTILYLLRSGEQNSHTKNVRKLLKNLSQLKFTITSTKNNKNETVIDMLGQGSQKYVGYIRSYEDGTNISLIVPAIENDPNAWLSARYYYIRTLQALE
jgi:hypothetical protein